MRELEQQRGQQGIVALALDPRRAGAREELAEQLGAAPPPRRDDVALEHRVAHGALHRRDGSVADGAVVGDEEVRVGHAPHVARVVPDLGVHLLEEARPQRPDSGQVAAHQLHPGAFYHASDLPFDMPPGTRDGHGCAADDGSAPTTPPEAYVFTATKDLMLPATVTGSWPRPRWYTENMWGRPLDTMMMNPWYREQFSDAHAIVVSDQERVGLDILTTGDYHLDEDVAGPLVASLPAAALEGPRARGAPDAQHALAAARPTRPARCSTRSTRRGAGRRVVGKVEHDPKNPLEYAKIWRIAQSDRRFGQADQVRHLLGPGARRCSSTATRPATTSTTRCSSPGTWPRP